VVGKGVESCVDHGGDNGIGNGCEEFVYSHGVVPLGYGLVGRRNIEACVDCFYQLVGQDGLGDVFVGAGIEACLDSGRVW